MILREILTVPLGNAGGTRMGGGRKWEITDRLIHTWKIELAGIGEA